MLERVADGLQLLRVALADGVHVGVRMALVDGDELGLPKPRPTIRRR
jgi:hypothetical protein